ncbi:PF13754 domain-containing protein [Holdemania sp. 1001302B_160321_E10]|uniref:PF13754 domain-containing protein n=1 Tax=Holdemania sp. 1001302B_160321_E10 TaxID=2787120 RepID=UPI00189C5919
MVTRVYGNAGLYFVEFKQDSRGLWTATIPFPDSYELVIDLYAEDDAGNPSFYTAYKILFDSSKLTYRLIPSPYRAVLLSQNITAKLMPTMERRG